MRFLIVSLLAAVCCANARAQQSNPFSIGIAVSPDFNDRSLSNNDGSLSSGIVVDVRDNNETWKPGYTAGPVISYRVSDKVDLETGILFSNKGFRHKKTQATYASQFDGTGFNGPIPDGHPSHWQFMYDHYYIDVPVKATFNFGKKRLRFTAGAGVAANVFVKETVRWKYLYEDGSSKRDSRTSEFDYNGLMISPQASIGVNYKLNERFHFKAEPTFRYGITNIINTPVTGRLWNAGLNLSFYFPFEIGGIIRNV